MSTIEVSLTTKEIYFLCELLDVEFILGLKDPYAGCSNSEIQEDWNQIKEGLLNKGILIEKETYGIERKHAILINAMRPDSICCRFSLIEDGKEISCQYYFTPKMVIKMTPDYHRDDHRIELAGTPKEIVSEIIHTFPVSHVQGSGESFSLPRITFEKVLVEEKSNSLNDDGFLAAMKCLKKAGQIQTIVWDDRELTWDHDDFHFIEGENGVWETSPQVVDGEEQVFIVPSSAEKIEEQIENMLLGRLFRD